MSLFSRLGRATRSAAKAFDGARYRIAGKNVRCLFCAQERFKRGEGQLNTAGASLLNLDWLNPSADVLVCTACSHIMWFAERTERLDD
jgi:hypothetical protein